MYKWVSISPTSIIIHKIPHFHVKKISREYKDTHSIYIGKLHIQHLKYEYSGSNSIPMWVLTFAFAYCSSGVQNITLSKTDQNSKTIKPNRFRSSINVRLGSDQIRGVELAWKGNWIVRLSSCINNEDIYIDRYILHEPIFIKKGLPQKW